jgi:DNA topoisomerase-1
VGSADGEGASADRELGNDPATGQAVTMRRGPYGVYVQLGEPGTDAKGKPTKPRRASLAAGQNPDGMTLEAALGLLSLPRVIGIDPESQEEITAGLGRFGAYVRCGSIFKSLDKDDDVLTVGLNRAVALLADARSRIRELGPHPKDGEMVVVRKGRFGPYAQHGRTVANLPRDLAMEDAALADMVTLLAEKGKEMKARGAAARKGAKGGARKAAAPATPAKPAAKAKAKASPTKPKAAAAKAKPATKAKPAAKAKAKPAARKSSR